MERTGEDKKIINLDVKKARSEISHDNVTKVNFLATIKFKVIASFIVPIMFIILLGSVAYLKASEVIESKYEKTAEDTINLAGEGMKIGFKSVQASAKLYTNDSLFQKYSLSYDDKAKAWQYRDSIGNVLSSRKLADELIRNMYLINEKVEAVSSGEGIDDGLYISFMETDLGKILDDNQTENVWDGEDAFLDKQLKASADDYSMRLIRKVSSVNAVLMIDVEADFVKNILSDMQFDKNGFLGLVTPDGKEIIDPGIDNKALETEKIFVDQAFYQEAMAGEEVSGSNYVDYKGDAYLFLYTKVSDTGAALCALIPKASITSQADSVRNVIIIIAGIACMIAVLIVTILSSRIDKQLRRP